jgi:tetratricopeptide (TPR) repeat protein
LAKSIDPENPIVRYCVEGMQREQEGRHEEALRLFMLAWDHSRDDLERTIAAHYVARHQTTPEQTLHWNQQSLLHADAVEDDSVKDFYPSLYLNMGKSHEDLGNLGDARRFYELAADRMDCLPDSPLADMVRQGVRNGLDRLAKASATG